MGTIASVLQWKCDCGLINPTEKSICYSCCSSRRRVHHQSVFNATTGFVGSKMSDKIGSVEFVSKTSLSRSISQNHTSNNGMLKSNSNQKISSHSPLKHSVSYSSSPAGINYYTIHFSFK